MHLRLEFGNLIEIIMSFHLGQTTCRSTKCLLEIYSVFATLSDAGEYPYNSDIGSPEEQSKAIVLVVTSLATGIRATI